MIFVMSGGSPIPECNLDNPAIMVSAFVNARNWKPDSRLRKLMKIRRLAKKKSSMLRRKL